VRRKESVLDFPVHVPERLRQKSVGKSKYAERWRQKGQSIHHIGTVERMRGKSWIISG
jgi:hypothetical protein